MIAFCLLVNLLLLPISLTLLLSSQNFGSSTDRAKCLSCGYDLRGIAGSICPECGDDQVGAQAFREGKRRSRMTAGMLLLGFAITIDFCALVLMVAFALQ
jgi:hypothetical protein